MSTNYDLAVFLNKWTGLTLEGCDDYLDIKINATIEIINKLELEEFYYNHCELFKTFCDNLEDFSLDTVDWSEFRWDNFKDYLLEGISNSDYDETEFPFDCVLWDVCEQFTEEEIRNFSIVYKNLILYYYCETKRYV